VCHPIFKKKGTWSLSNFVLTEIPISLPYHVTTYHKYYIIYRNLDYIQLCASNYVCVLVYICIL
jgi:hypothetical protein